MPSRNRYTPGPSGIVPGAGRYVDGSATPTKPSPAGRHSSGYGAPRLGRGAPRRRAQARVMLLPSTAISTAGSAFWPEIAARITEPSSIEYWLPWHWQLMMPSLIDDTIQP